MPNASNTASIGFEQQIWEAATEVNVFFVPPAARWIVISESARKEEIGIVIDDAMRAIEKENSRHCREK